ncbi:hypothetical protein [Blautia sp. MSJ-36]|uniref:hypothetical protein n=1 Tax=Blautia sp. MSJ-36 TaxID=2841530 RepID=UPI001C100BA0|nr:hypothetical protein [Blautia sp. MSJ-36]MBU5446323.1 hypothetical protein [Blautia sp. MSJ-36]
MSISDMMSKHTIVDVNEHIHVVDGKVIYYEPDTIDFEDENQVSDFFDIVSEIFVNELLPERYGKGNTYAVITGMKSDRTKSISTQGMHHFPLELKEKVQQAVVEYENQLKNEHIHDMMKQHVIVDVNEHIHVIDGKVLYYEPDTIDFEDEEQVENFFGMVEDLFVHELYPERYGHGNTMLVITGDKDCVDKYLSMNGMHHFPPELKKKVKVAIDEYRNGAGNNV